LFKKTGEHLLAFSGNGGRNDISRVMCRLS